MLRESIGEKVKLFSIETEVEESKESKSSKDGEVDDNPNKKKTKRRSLRLKKKEEVMEVIDLGSPEPVNKEETSNPDSKQEIGIH